MLTKKLDQKGIAIIEFLKAVADDDDEQIYGKEVEVIEHPCV